MGSYTSMDHLAAELFLKSCFLDTVFVTLFCTACEMAVSGVHKLLHTGGVPTSLILLFWWWLTVSLVFWWWLRVSLVFLGQSAGMNSHRYLIPTSPSLISHIAPQKKERQGSMTLHMPPPPPKKKRKKRKEQMSSQN